MATNSDTRQPGVRVTGRRKVVFALAGISLSVAFTVGALLAVDVYYHDKFEAAAGLNVRGYRGPTVGRKLSHEQRVFVLGGSTAFGYGLSWGDAFPAVLERKLQEETLAPTTARVVNLAYNNEGAFSFQYTLRDYENLQPDIVVFYTGYNDNGGFNISVFRHQSAVFRLTGYMPILPVILAEKAMAIRYGGDLGAAYAGEKTVFRPNLAQRTTATAFETAAAISQSLEKQLGRITDTPSASAVDAAISSCGRHFVRYCDSVIRAVKDVLDRGRDAVVVTQPYISDLHVAQQELLHDILRKRFGANPALRLVNLGRAVDLKDRELSFDGMHLTARGNELIADPLVRVIADIVARGI